MTHLFSKVKGLVKKVEDEQENDDNANEEQLHDWESELKRLQELRPFQAVKDQVKMKDIPELEDQMKKQEESLPQLSIEAEEVMPLFTLRKLLSTLVGSGAFGQSQKGSERRSNTQTTSDYGFKVTARN